MTNKDAFKEYFKAVIKDLAGENRKVPVGKFRAEANEYDAQLWSPDWFQYMIFGRGPGKAPPPDRMLKWVEDNPDVYADAKRRFKYINEKGLAFLIGRKIAQHGTDIWEGKRKGLGFIESMERNMPDLLKSLVKNEAIKIQTALHRAIKG